MLVLYQKPFVYKTPPMTFDKKKQELAKSSENIQFISLLACWKRICHVYALHLFKCRKTNDDKTRTLNEPATEKVTWICRRPRRINYNTIISILTEELCYTNTLARTESLCTLRNSYFKDPNKKHLCDEAVEFCVAFCKHVERLKKARWCCNIVFI